MAKIIESPVEHFKGTVELSDPLTFPQVIAFQDAVRETMNLINENGRENIALAKLHYAMLPGILPCIEKWQLKNLPKKLTIKNFPATPMTAAGLLVDWLRDEITSLVVEAETVPNE
ncbi:MAG: hypothetical protein E3J37_07265 [Anaerolineales bacterium]|nr:MAG: hypothetical protein E3J37_07265 [Anaerolineales bacterium]